VEVTLSSVTLIRLSTLLQKKSDEDLSVHDDDDDDDDGDIHDDEVFNNWDWYKTFRRLSRTVVYLS